MRDEMKVNQKSGRNDLCRICRKKMKYCKCHHANNAKKIFYLFIVLVGVMIFIISSYFIFYKPKNDIVYHNNKNVSFTIKIPEQTENLSNHELILRKLCKEKISLKYTPVHIYRNNIFAGSGTLFKTQEGLRIASSGHLFYKRFGKCYYSYQVICPLEDRLYPINHILGIDKNNFQKEIDFVFCIPGQERLIEGFLNDDDIFSASCQPLSDDTYAWFTSLVTGKKYHCVGSSFNSENMPYLILDYDGLPGESGSGFINDFGHLLVLKGSSYITPVMKKILPFNDKSTRFSLGVIFSE